MVTLAMKNIQSDGNQGAHAFTRQHAAKYLKRGFDAMTNAYQVCNASSPIFIVGQQRTGTPFIERIITARDGVHSAGELQQFGRAVKSIGGAGVMGMVSSENVLAAVNVERKYLGGYEGGDILPTVFFGAARPRTFGIKESYSFGG